MSRNFGILSGRPDPWGHSGIKSSAYDANTRVDNVIQFASKPEGKCAAVLTLADRKSGEAAAIISMPDPDDRELAAYMLVICFVGLPCIFLGAAYLLLVS